MKLALTLVAAVVIVPLAASSCTPQEAQSAINAIVEIAPDACQIVEDIDASPVVTLLCNEIDAMSGAVVGQQKVSLPRTDAVYVALKASATK